MKTRIFSSLFSRLPLSYLLLPFLTFFLVSVASAQIPSSGLVGYWPFNGNANDESGNGNNGTVNGATLTTDRFGNANSAYSFDGVNDFIEVPVQQIGVLNYSISCWFKYASNANNTTYKGLVQASGAYPNGQFSFNLQISAGTEFVTQGYHKVSASINGPGVFDGWISNNSINDNTWHCLVGVFHGSAGSATNTGNIELYLDGVLINSNSTAVNYSSVNAPVNGQGNTRFGVLHYAPTERFFDGILDDISIYNRALTPTEVSQLYSDQTSTVATPPCPTLATNLQIGLVGYWPFCGNANDESGNGNNGVVNTSVSTLTADRMGNPNSAYSFQNALGGISVNNFNFPDGNYSVGAWVNVVYSPGALSSKNIISHDWNNGGEMVLFLNEPESESVNFDCKPNTGNALASPVLGNSWNHFILQRDGLVFKLYMNGVLIQQGTKGMIPIISNHTLFFGGDPSGTQLSLFNGKLDDICIWNRVLSEAEITQLYTNPSTTPPVACTPFLGEDQTVCAGTSVTLSASGSSLACPTLPSNLQTGLVGYWPFCGNTNDASGNGNNGTVNGASLTTDRFGNTNSALQFSNGSQIMCTNNQIINPTEFSIFLWFNSSNSQVTGMEGIGRIFGFDDGQCQHIFSQDRYIDLTATGQVRFHINHTSGNYFIYSSSGKNDGNWHSVACTFGASGMKLYVDGVLEAFNSNNLVSAYNGYWRAGGLNDNYSPSIMGKVDDISLYNRVLSNSEITSMHQLSGGITTYLWSTGATTASINVTPTTTTTYTCTVTDANGNVCTDSVAVFVPQIEATDLTICAGESTTLSVSGINSVASPSGCPTLPTNLQTGLVGYWPFCGNANDASGNGNDGTVNGATLTTDRFGNANSAYSFDGVNDRISISHNQALSPSIVTISLWFNASTFLNTDGNQSQLVSKREFSGWGSAYELGIGKMPPDYLNSSTNTLYTNYTINNNNYTKHYSNSSLTINDWHHAAYSHDGQSVKFYIDGILVYDTPSNGVLSDPGQLPLWFGGRPGGIGRSFYNGLLDDIAIYNRALTATEIQQLYTLGQTTYLWSTGATTPTINVSPTSTATYTCTVTTNGVSCTDEVTVVVSNPVIDLGANVTLCGTSTTLTAPSGYDSYLWSNGGTTNTTTVTANGTYSCAVTQGGCSASDSIDVTLIDATITASDTTICAGETVTLSVPQGGSTNTACPTLPTNLQTGLVGYWPFCGNANDASGNGNNGTVNGATLTTDRFGNANSAYSFDGVNDFIEVPVQQQNVFNYSIGCWFNYPSNPSSGFYKAMVQASGGYPNSTYSLSLQMSAAPILPYSNFTNKVSVSINGPGVFNGWTSNNVYNDNDWHYLSGVLSVSGGVTNSSDIQMYLDGNLINSSSFPVDYGSVPTPVNGTGNTLFGMMNHLINGRYYEGQLDDIAIYNRALSANEIQQLYTLGQTTYLWSNGATTPTINVSPTTTTTYTCTVTTNGVSCTDSVTVVVSQPVASITPNGIVEICQGQSIALSANGGVSYLWNTGAPTQSITVNTEAVYTVTVTDANGCTDTESQLVKVNFLPNIGVSNASICPGQSTTLTATGGLSYVWSPATGLSSTTGSTVTASPSTSTVYTVTGTGANGCTNTATAAVAVNAAPTATITPATATTFCQGGSVVLNANTGTGLSYQWYNNAAIISGATSASYTANASGSYTVVVTNTSTCSATSTTTVVTVNALPTATITPATATTFCQGGSVVLNANTGAGLSYQWYNNAVVISGATTSSYTANASGSYTVVVTNASTCSATSTATVVTVNALPTATITPATATTFCQGGSVVLNANTGTGLSYQWYNNAAIISGATSASYTANASGSYTVVVTNTSTCSATSTATVVTVNALPTATITPATATTFCQGGSVVLNANTGTGLTYQWRLNGTNITGATSSSYTANASGSYTVVVTNASTCSATSTAMVVTVNALPTATITASSATTFCQGGSVVLNANTGTGLSYQWRLNGTNITGATSASYTANASGSYTVVVTNTSTCSATSTATVVTVNALPTATITPATATTFCQGGSVVLNANTGTGLTYQWRLNGTNITGATSASYTANASGSYTVVVTNASTCSSTSTATVVTVNALPTATITASSATTFCQGGSVVLTANTGAGLSYQWYNNATIISGATSASYTANASGSYTVVVTNASACSATSTATVVTVNALPTATITPASATTFCQGGSVVLNANTGTGLTYQWYNNASAISGVTSSSYTANASGSYTVVVTNASTCSATSTATVVTVNALPTATITPATATTFCQGGSVVLNANTGTGLSYQWFNNASAISGATTSSYTANASGSYTVVVTNTSTCSSTSTATVVTVVPNVDYFADADGDGFGDPATLVSTCIQPQGYVTDNTDCDDTSADVNPAVAELCNHIDDDCSGTIDDGLVFNTYYADVDGDTYGDANNSIYECSQPDGYVTNNTDCNDNNANQNIASTEICNGEDDDCDGQIDNGLIFLDYYADIDSDGFGAGAATNSCVDLGTGYVTNNTDCDDNNANQNTASIEICNGEDDDCDGTIDNGITFLDYYADTDGDGFGAGDVISSCSDLGAGYVSNNTDCDDTNGNTNPNATETCNTIDDNCDGQIDEGVQTVYFIDNDGDTYGNPSVSILACTQPIGYTPDDTDCNDNDANINPGAEDIGGNGIDENCDGQIDNSIFELNATISLYPNPTRSELNIQVNSSIIGSDLYIFDAVGKLVFKQQLLSTQTTIPVSNFADGNYVVRVGEVVKRFVVQK